MSEDKDIYSSIYSALKHPIRRRILGMLSGRTRTFTEMQDVLGIESSHLTYHLEFLEEFISKTEDGSYMLSAFGELAVSMMKDINRTQEGKGTGKITKYWLPFKRAPYLSSIAIEKDDVWFLMSVGDFQGSHGIGQIRLKGSKAEFYQYVLGWRFKKIQSDIELKQRDAFLSKLSEENWRRIDLGITAHDGCVWYGEREGGYRRRIMTTERQALCKLHSKTHRVTRYIFPSPNELSIEYVARTLKIDSLGRRVWGTTGRNNGWVFDTSARKLRVLTIGKFIE